LQLCSIETVQHLHIPKQQHNKLMKVNPFMPAKRMLTHA
jgi:hypothetical protein